MRRIVKENTANISYGSINLHMPQRERWNTFSKPEKPIDRYPRSKRKRGKLNPELEKMNI